MFPCSATSVSAGWLQLAQPRAVFPFCCPDPICLSCGVSAQSCTWGSLQRFPPCLVGYVPFTHPSRMFDFLCACDSAALFALASQSAGSSPADLLSSKLFLHCVFRLLTFPIYLKHRLRGSVEQLSAPVCERSCCLFVLILSR